MPAFDPLAETVFHVPYPEFTHFTSASAAFAGKTRTVTMQMAADVAAPAGSAGLWKAYFNDGTILVYCHGAAEIPNIPIAPGQVKLLRGSDLQPLATGSATVSGSTVTLTVTTLQLAPGGPVPAGGIGLEWCETKYLDAATISLKGMAALDLVPGSYFWLAAAPASWFSLSLITEQPGDVPSQNWKRFRAEPRLRTGPGVVSLPKPTDITGDGRTDWDSDSDTHVEGDTYVDGWISDADSGGWFGDCIIIVIGHDTNQNGKLDGSEVTDIIGKCIYDPGANSAKIFPIPDGSVIHHWNWEDSNRDGDRDPGERARHYIYNTKTGKLKVYDENGNLLFFGDPDDYGW